MSVLFTYCCRRLKYKKYAEIRTITIRLDRYGTKMKKWKHVSDPVQYLSTEEWWGTIVGLAMYYIQYIQNVPRSFFIPRRLSGKTSQKAREFTESGRKSRVGRPAACSPRKSVARAGATMYSLCTYRMYVCTFLLLSKPSRGKRNTISVANNNIKKYFYNVIN